MSPAKGTGSISQVLTVFGKTVGEGEVLVVRAEQTVSEMAVEVLARQAEALGVSRELSFEEAFPEVLKSEAGRQLCELAEGSHRHEKARFWQANLQFERVFARQSE
jgi:hypothetical protein